MAHLLGSRYCIESLHDDVSDLQLAVVDVFSRSGPVTCPSWKYPDKAAADVNVEDLLECHRYSDDEEERQVAHIILLELVIDRLVVLLQAMARFLEQTLALSRAGSASAPSSNSTSIGLVVRKYWNKVIHLHTVSQQLHSEVKSKTRKVGELEEEVEQLTHLVESLRSGTGEVMLDLSGRHGNAPSVDALLPGGLDAASLATLLTSRKKAEISRDECNKACQTVETAFVPCEECHRVQNNLRELGQEVTKILRSQEMPSLLERHMGYVKDLDWLTHHDISRWTVEQRKDLVVLRKHMTWLRDKVDPLEARIEKEEERNKKQTERISQLNKDLTLEKETQSIQLSNFEKKFNEARAEKQVEIDRLTRDLNQAKGRLTHLQQEVDMGKVHKQQQDNKLHQLETENSRLQRELEESQTEGAELRRLQGEVRHLGCQVDKARGRLSEVTRELNKEKARNKSVNKHTESLQGKQDSLLERIDNLDVENDDLRCQLADLHEEKDRLEDELHAAKSKSVTASEKRQQQEAKVEQLMREKVAVESRVAELEVKVRTQEERLSEMREKQRLIVEYPDLHGPVNRQLEGTGDITADMENQVKANGIRIEVLEEQNSSLRKTITKMLQNQHTMMEPSPAPMPLWKPSDARVAMEDERHDVPEVDDFSADVEDVVRQDSQSQVKLFHKRQPSDKPLSASRGRGEREWLPPETFTVKKAPPNNRPKSGKQRPASAKTAPTGGTASASSISAYIQLKRCGLLKSAGPTGRSRPSSGVSKVASEPPGGSTQCCHKCDRTFHHKKDLEIHRNYCFGGL